MVHGAWVAAAGDAQAQTPGSEPALITATGQTISLDLKGVEIVDVLKLLSQQSGLNFVAGHNVTGRVTVFAKDVDLWEAFERIVDANDLAYERQGSLISVMTARDYELLYGDKFQARTRQRAIVLTYAKASQLAVVLNQVKSSVGRVVADEGSNTLILNDVPLRLEEMVQLVAQLDRPTSTWIYSLNYANAEKLKDKVQELLTPGVGTVSIDARTNKLVVTDLRSAMPKLAHVIEAFDAREGEVLIEAKLVKVELSDTNQLGIDWQRAFAGVDTTARSNFRVLSDIVGGTATGGALKFLAAPSGKAQIIIEALKKFGKVDTVSNPRITVLNNQEAKILVGTKEAFVTVTTTVPTTGSVINSPQIQFVDVGTKLFVTPQIKRDGRVQLKIRPEVSTSKVETFENNRIPIVSTTEAETNVLVQSGSTVIIGGLIDSRLERNRSQVPLLGDIPLIGVAFRNRDNTTKKTELVVFLSPQIISPNGERVTSFESNRSVERIAEPEGAGAQGVPAGYQAIIRRRLSDLFAAQLRSLALKEGSVTMAFSLSHDGRVVGTPDITSSDGEAMVRLAQDALAAAEPFPPFPVDVTTSPVRFRLTLESHP